MAAHRILLQAAVVGQGAQFHNSAAAAVVAEPDEDPAEMAELVVATREPWHRQTYRGIE